MEKAVVFDIDGTLTVNQYEFWEARPFAAKVVQSYVDKGYRVIYCSARAALTEGFTTKWLQRNGFPELPLYEAETLADQFFPSTFKTRVLKRLIETGGWQFEYAYGDMPTDFEAYASVGIPQERVFALRHVNANDCEPGVYGECLSGYEVHMAYLDTVPKVTL